MKKIRIIGRDQPTTDFGILKSGDVYTISDPLAAFLIRRGMGIAVTATKKTAKKKPVKKK